MAAPTPTPTTITLEAHDKQRAFLLSKAPNVVFQGGAGSGKTYAGVLKGCLTPLEQPGSRGLYVSPTHKMFVRASRPHLLSVALKLGLLHKWEWNKTEGCITFPNGSVLFLGSAEEPESLLGADIAWAVGDEVALWKHDAYRYLMGRLRQPGYPHQAAFTFTPKGHNWAYEALGIERDGLDIIRASSFDNQFLDPDYYERLRREYGEGSRFWQQEVMGHYITWEGLVYASFSVERHVSPLPADAQIVRTVAAVDWGWTNPGVMLCLSLLADGRIWATEEVYERERSLEWWADQGQRLQRERGAHDFPCDPSEPANIDHLQRVGLGAAKANNEVLPGITAVAGRFANDTIRVAPSCVNLIRELGMYSYKQRPDGSIKADEPDKTNDHACDVLRYGVMALTTPDDVWLY
jgi:phage terminase large subunit